MMTHEKHRESLLGVTIANDGTVSYTHHRGSPSVTKAEMVDLSKYRDLSSFGCDAFFSVRNLAVVELIEITASRYKLPPTQFFVYVSDSYCYQCPDLPIFVFAKPLNRNGILFPDNTFKCSASWDTFKSNANAAKQDKRSQAKTPVLFFRGAKTGPAFSVRVKNGQMIEDHKWNTRQYLQAVYEHDNRAQISTGRKKQNMLDWIQYKYLLNLPGGQPWSYRFKYLLAMGSIVIDVVVHQQYGSDSQMYNERWNNFFDGFMKANIHFVEMPIRWIEGNQSFNDREHDLLAARLIKVFDYYEGHPQEYAEMQSNAEQRIEAVTESCVYEGMSIVINEYANAVRRGQENAPPPPPEAIPLVRKFTGQHYQPSKRRRM